MPTPQLPAIARDPDRASSRANRDKEDSHKIKRVFDASGGRYGARKIWRTLRRESYDIARCTVERLMKASGIQGVVRGKKVITTNPDTSQSCPDDRVNREFVAQRPNQLWVSDFTYVPSWQGTVYVAFVIDVFAWKIEWGRHRDPAAGRRHHRYLGRDRQLLAAGRSKLRYRVLALP